MTLVFESARTDLKELPLSFWTYEATFDYDQVRIFIFGLRAFRCCKNFKPISFLIFEKYKCVPLLSSDTTKWFLLRFRKTPILGEAFPVSYRSEIVSLFDFGADVFVMVLIFCQDLYFGEFYVTKFFCWFSDTILWISPQIVNSIKLTGIQKIKGFRTCEKKSRFYTNDQVQWNWFGGNSWSTRERIFLVLLILPWHLI